MIDDMTMRKLQPKTQAGYLRSVKNFTRFFGRTLLFTTPLAMLTDRPALARALTEPRLAVALFASLTAACEPGIRITRRELAKTG